MTTVGMMCIPMTHVTFTDLLKVGALLMMTLLTLEVF